jgi:hypothetical protein
MVSISEVDIERLKSVIGRTIGRDLYCSPEANKNSSRRSRFQLLLQDSNYNSGTSSSATMFMILIKGLMAGPAVSL